MQPSRQPNSADADVEMEPFPSLPDQTSNNPDATADLQSPVRTRPTASSSISGRFRRVSESFEQSDPPEGFFAATGSIASSIFAGQTSPRAHASSDASNPTMISPIGGPSRRSTIPPVTEEPQPTDMVDQPRSIEKDSRSLQSTSAATKPLIGEPAAAAPYPNGYHFPPKHTTWQSTRAGLVSFWHYFLTPVGFCVVVYGLNVVAWGGMLFLLLCNAAPAMCQPSCNHIDSPRRKWIEWDSQILNALFCVTGFGLAPWRFRDLYYLLQYRIKGNTVALRRLGGIHRGWFRLPGSQELDIHIGPETIANHPSTGSNLAVPYPETKIPDAPLTGERAPATPLWKMDAVIWLMVWNTFLQCCLAGFMWALNRFDRPSWSTGLFVALACIVAAVAGIMMFMEGKKVKGIEGVPISDQDRQKLAEDRENGVWHFNNIKAKDLSEDGKKKKKKKDKVNK